MDKRPQYTAAASNEELRHGLHQVMRHNANTPYPYAKDDGHIHSHHHTPSYGSPAPRMNDTMMHVQDHYWGTHRYQDLEPSNFAALDIRNDGSHGTANPYHQNDTYLYPALPPNQQGLPSNGPPTPRSSANSEGGRRRVAARSRAETTPTDGSQTNSPRSRPKQAKSKDKTKTPKLTAPLSELTKNFDNVPLKDMGQYVNRPLEARLAETAKRNGYVTRPMNSFMLYRSAYAERTKVWCLQNNHQVVSAVSGLSWPMEPPEIRDMYTDFAKIERANHHAAHPSYKFSPSKAGAAARKRKGNYSGDEIDDEFSDTDDGDGEWGTPSTRKARPRQARKLTRHVTSAGEASRPSSSSDAYNSSIDGSPGPYHGHIRSTPSRMDPLALYNQQLQMNSYQNQAAANMNDPRYMMTEPAGMPYRDAPSMIGLPNSEHRELFQVQSRAGTPMPQTSPLDPMLLAYDTTNYGNHGLQQLEIPYKVKVEQDIDRLISQSEDLDLAHSGMPSGPVMTTTAEYQPHLWDSDALKPMETDSQFDQWMDEHHPT